MLWFANKTIAARRDNTGNYYRSRTLAETMVECALIESISLVNPLGLVVMIYKLVIFNIIQWFVTFTNLANRYANLQASGEPKIFTEPRKQKSTILLSKTGAENDLSKTAITVLK